MSMCLAGATRVSALALLLLCIQRQRHKKDLAAANSRACYGNLASETHEPWRSWPSILWRVLLFSKRSILGQVVDFGGNFSPDGKLIASGSDDSTVRLREAATGASHSEPLKGHSGCVRSIAFSSDSKSNTARTPLSYAAEERHEAVVKLLLENPVDNPLQI